MSIPDRLNGVLAEIWEEHGETIHDDIRVALQAYTTLPPPFRALIDALNAAAASGIMDHNILKLTGQANAALMRVEATRG